MLVPLTSLKEGERGVITSIETNPRGRKRRSWGFLKRLMDMGLTPGTKITVIKSAPFRGPIEVYVRGSRLALGRGMATKIFVEIDK